MKKIFLAVAVFISVSLGVSANGSKGGKMKRMTEVLNLSVDQQTQVKKINDTYKVRLDELDSDMSLSRSDKREKRCEVMREKRNNINAVLTPGQQQKWKDLRGKKKRHMDGCGSKSKERVHKHHRADLDEKTVNKLGKLKEDYKKERQAILMSKSASDAQQKKLSDLKKEYRNKRREVLGKVSR